MQTRSLLLNDVRPCYVDPTWKIVDHSDGSMEVVAREGLTRQTKIISGALILIGLLIWILPNFVFDEALFELEIFHQQEAEMMVVTTLAWFILTTMGGANALLLSSQVWEEQHHGREILVCDSSGNVTLPRTRSNASLCKNYDVVIQVVKDFLPGYYLYPIKERQRLLEEYRRSEGKSPRPILPPGFETVVQLNLLHLKEDEPFVYPLTGERQGAASLDLARKLSEKTGWPFVVQLGEEARERASRELQEQEQATQTTNLSTANPTSLQDE